MFYGCIDIMPQFRLTALPKPKCGNLRQLTLNATCRKGRVPTPVAVVAVAVREGAARGTRRFVIPRTQCDEREAASRGPAHVPCERTDTYHTVFRAHLAVVG